MRLREHASTTKAVTRYANYAVAIGDPEQQHHASCSIPVTTYSGAFSNATHLLKGLTRTSHVDQDQRRALAHAFARSLGRKDDVELVDALAKGEAPASDMFYQPTQESLDAAGMELARLQKRGHVSSDDFHAWLRKQLDIQRNILARSMSVLEPSKKGLHTQEALSPLLLAEIRASIAASLHAIQPSPHDTFPATRTNVVLHSPANSFEATVEDAVASIAHELNADTVVLQAQDLAQLAGDYLGESAEPTPNSIRALGYDTFSNLAIHDAVVDLDGTDHMDGFEDEQDASSDAHGSSSPGRRPIPFIKMVVMRNLGGALKDLTHNLGKSSLLTGGALGEPNSTSGGHPSRSQTQSEVQLEDLKIAALLETLVDSVDLKRKFATSSHDDPGQESVHTSDAATEGPGPINSSPGKPKLFDFSFEGDNMSVDVTEAVPSKASLSMSFVSLVKSPDLQPDGTKRPKIILVKDIKELSATQYGSKILQKLEEIVRNQRKAGERVMIVGITCSQDLTPSMSTAGVQALQSEGQNDTFRTIVVAPGQDVGDDFWRTPGLELRLSDGERSKFQGINIRHIQDMLRSLDPEAATALADIEQTRTMARPYLPIFSKSIGLAPFSYDEAHRIALTALGLHTLDDGSDSLNWGHVALAMNLLKASDTIKYAYVNVRAEELAKPFAVQYRARMEDIKARRESRKSGDRESNRAQDLGRIRANATQHEKKLMHGIVDAENIKTTFDQVHVPEETVEAIRTVTSMSLLRPDAFNYGILATEKVSGALLYGPPGTGKTLLAKAVAKESGCRVLEISGSSIMDKYVGEGEKNVAAIFSLARKLSPCVVFLDEADAIFSTRDASRERTSHREILNQFLKEWDGLSTSSVFVMVATNRPFDMDDAVIRRLPRRLLIDLPTEKDRKKILDIHLRDEQLDSSIDLDDIAKRTPLYSGSDLKNVAVFAALACVREENEQAALAHAQHADASTPTAQTADKLLDEMLASSTSATPDTANANANHQDPPAPSHTPILIPGLKYTFPERRTLHPRHFEKALLEVSASISENMSSLNAIKKFDEQYGDKKGRRKRNPYGFGVGEASVEAAARVRT